MKIHLTSASVFFYRRAKKSNWKNILYILGTPLSLSFHQNVPRCFFSDVSGTYDTPMRFFLTTSPLLFFVTRTRDCPPGGPARMNTHAHTHFGFSIGPIYASIFVRMAYLMGLSSHHPAQVVLPVLKEALRQLRRRESRQKEHLLGPLENHLSWKI